MSVRFAMAAAACDVLQAGLCWVTLQEKLGAFRLFISGSSFEAAR